MKQKMNVKTLGRGMLLGIVLMTCLFSWAWGQEYNYIWLTSFNPGSAELTDDTIDQGVLAFLDSLMKRTDIDVTFLGAADKLQWKQSNKVNQVSKAFDSAKKWERASALRERYGRGNIGTTDENMRGVKVIWGPKEPSIFEMNDRIEMLENMTDSLTLALLALNNRQKYMNAIEDTSLHGTMTAYTEVSQNFFDWEVNSGMFLWSQGAPYDLAVPFLGIALKHYTWSLEFQGGFTPWSQKAVGGNRGDAFLMSTFHIMPRSFVHFKVGGFSGWEFLTNSDQWTMKVMGLTAGPTMQWKWMNVYVGSNIAKLSTMTDTGTWGYSIIVATGFNFEL
ncbi:hypothetical protein JW960_02410 [candidate division KSB1 bacterium]|nr:hypothetical protein [candidate division KSB1 bacterium]